MEILSFIVKNLFPIVAMIGAIGLVIIEVYNFLTKPTENQIASLQEFLKAEVVKAEQALGSGTGELKLRQVYDAAVKAYPWVGKFMTFERFSKLVDIALDWMKEQMENNIDISNLIKKKDE